MANGEGYKTGGGRKKQPFGDNGQYVEKGTAKENVDGNRSYRQNTDYQAILDNDKRREAVKKYSDTPKEDLTALGLDDRTFLEDEYVGKSVGAKTRNYDIPFEGKVRHIAEGTYIRNKEQIAGKGMKRQIDEIEGLVKKYGGDSREWRKMKGVATLDIDGKYEEVELHWYEEPSVGKVKIKTVKR